MCVGSPTAGTSSSSPSPPDNEFETDRISVFEPLLNGCNSPPLQTSFNNTLRLHDDPGARHFPPTEQWQRHSNGCGVSLSILAPMVNTDLRLAVRTLRQSPTFTLHRSPVARPWHRGLHVGVRPDVRTVLRTAGWSRSAGEPRPDLSARERATGRARAFVRRVRLLPRSRHRVH